MQGPEDTCFRAFFIFPSMCRRASMQVTRMTRPDQQPDPDTRWVILFDDRYGAGAHARLLRQLDEPCTSFAEIASQFGVTRERVRQWHLQFRPGAPRGHQRRRFCIRQQRKREVLADPLFRSFYRHARSHFEPHQFSLIALRTGFSRRSVRLGGRLVAIRTARPDPRHSADGLVAYQLSPRGQAVDFIYYRLEADAFLFLPGHMLPLSGAIFIDDAQSKYWPYRNSFLAARPSPTRFINGDSLNVTAD